jgi:hypothetical protein
VSASTRRGGCRRARTWKAAPDLAATTERARGEPPRGRGRRESCRGGALESRRRGASEAVENTQGCGGGRRREE